MKNEYRKGRKERRRRRQFHGEGAEEEVWKPTEEAGKLCILLHLQLLSSIDSIVLTQCSAKEGRRRSGGRERKEKVFFSTFLFSMLYCAYLKRKYEE